MRWAGSVVIITGASRGIGASIAREAGARGASVGLIARNADDLARALAASGGRGAIAPADVGDRAQVTNAIEKLVAELGPPDIVVANAGIGMYGAFAECDVMAVEEMVRVNLLGTVYALRAVLPGMIERRHGHIVTIGSIAGQIGAPFEAAYSATKFGQVGLTEALAVEVAPFGIDVSVVNPGPVTTAFFETRGHLYERRFPRAITPEEVTAAVMRAVETGRREQTVPAWLGRAVVVRHVFPRLHRWGTARAFRGEQ